MLWLDHAFQEVSVSPFEDTLAVHGTQKTQTRMPALQPYHNKPRIRLSELRICLLCPDCKLNNEDASAPRSHSSNSHSVCSWVNAPVNEQLPVTTAGRSPGRMEARYQCPSSLACNCTDFKKSNKLKIVTSPPLDFFLESSIFTCLSSLVFPHYICSTQLKLTLGQKKKKVFALFFTRGHTFSTL